MGTEARLNANLVCLQRAVLCANCEVISEGANGHCGACGSQALLRLSPLLGGPMTGLEALAFNTSGEFTLENSRGSLYSSAAA
jgi:hypothetical protein